MLIPAGVRCPSEEPLRVLVESFAAALGLRPCDVHETAQQALGLCTPNLEHLLGGQREGAPWRYRKDDVYHRTKGKAISESKAVLYAVTALDALGVFVEVHEQFYEKLDVPLDIDRRQDEAALDDDHILRALDLDGHARQWVAAALHVWDEFLMGVEELHAAGFVRLSVSVDRLASRDLRLSLARFVQSLAAHRSQRAKTAARSRSPSRSLPARSSGLGRAGEPGAEPHPTTLRAPSFQFLIGEHEAARSSYRTSELCACLDDVMTRAGIVDGVSPALVAERVQRAVETEVVRGIVEARLVSTREFTGTEHRARLARYASLPTLSGLSPTHPPAEVGALPRTSVVVPVTLVSTYILLEFVRTHWGVPLDIILLDMASAATVFPLLKQQSPDLAIVPRASAESLDEHGADKGYIPLTTLGRSSHSVIVSTAHSSDFREVSARKLDMLCVGKKTPQRFLADLVRLRLLDRNRVSVSSTDAGNGLMMPASVEALAEKAAVVAYFPMNALMAAIGLGQIAPLDRLEESTSSHVLLARLDRAADTRWAELVVRILHSARECLVSEPRYFRTTVEHVVASKRFMDAFIRCLKN